VLQDKLSGKFIVLDGPDGCGKTTQLDLLAEYLEKHHCRVVKTNDPGGTKIGDQIRHLLKYGAETTMDVHTEVMLFMASRAQLAAEVITSALKAGKVVLCDRYISATCAYQGSSGYPVEKIIELGRCAVGDVWPDLTIILDVPVEKARRRTGRQPNQKRQTSHQDAHQPYLFENATADLFDSRSLQYHRKVRKWFLKLQDFYPRPVGIVQAGSDDIQTIHQRLVELITQADL